MDLADGPLAQARVREAVVAVDSDLLPEVPLLTVAVWVPQRETGEVVAAMVAELVVGVPPGPDPVAELVRGAARAPRRRGERTLEYSVAPGELPAGPASIQTRTWADWGSRLVRTAITWTVVAPGASEAVVVEFSTTTPGMYDGLVDQSVTTMGTLRLEIA